MRVILFLFIGGVVVSCASDSTDYSPMIAPIDQRAVKEKEAYLESIRLKDSIRSISDTTLISD